MRFQNSISEYLEKFSVQAALGIVSAVLYFFSTPAPDIYYHWGPLIFFALLPVFLSLACVKSETKGFLILFIFSFTVYLLSMYWLKNSHWIIWLSFSLLYALYYAFLGPLYVFLNRRLPFLNPVSFPFLWILADWARAQGWWGLPFGNAAQSLFNYPYFIQAAEIGGELSVTFVIVSLNAVWAALAISFFKKRRMKKGELAVIFLLFAVFVASFLFSYFRFKSFKNQSSLETLSVLAVNPDVDEIDESARLNAYINLSQKGLESFWNADLLVWNEGSVVSHIFLKEGLGEIFYNFDEPDVFRLRKFIINSQKPLLLGGYVYDYSAKKRIIYNCSLLISSRAEILDYYCKNRLIFFGEYLPEQFSFLNRFAENLYLTQKKPMSKKTVFEINNWRFIAPICSENGFGDLVAGYAKNKDVDFMVNLSNDNFLKSRRASFQHLAANAFRAVENRFPVVFSTNSGYSGMMDEKGVIDEKSMLEKAGYALFRLEK